MIFPLFLLLREAKHESFLMPQSVWQIRTRNSQQKKFALGISSFLSLYTILTSACIAKRLQHSQLKRINFKISPSANPSDVCSKTIDVDNIYSFNVPAILCFPSINAWKQFIGQMYKPTNQINIA